MEWPKNARFAFTIIDDTDNATVSRVKPLYDLLDELGLRTTKTVWVYPPRDDHQAESLSDRHYLEFVRDLQQKGFEIALHGVGSGSFERAEIRRGLDLFEELIGEPPLIHVNHRSNPDNIFWGEHRFNPLLARAIRLLYGDRRTFHGHDSDSPHFWGDICKERIRYIRNHVFNGIVTSNYDPYGPYRVEHKERFSNYWFSSSDGHNARTFTRLLAPANLSELERSGGYSIVYAHLASGFVDGSGRVQPLVEQRLRDLASRGGWFVPAGTLLEHLRLQQQEERKPLPPAVLQRLDTTWLGHRVAKAGFEGVERLARTAAPLLGWRPATRAPQPRSQQTARSSR